MKLYITADWLRSVRACAESILWFKNMFGDKAEVTVANVKKWQTKANRNCRSRVMWLVWFALNGKEPLRNALVARINETSKNKPKSPIYSYSDALAHVDAYYPAERQVEVIRQVFEKAVQGYWA